MRSSRTDSILLLPGLGISSFWKSGHTPRGVHSTMRVNISLERLENQILYLVFQPSFSRIENTAALIISNSRQF